jgi:hypothetical protein
MFAAAPALVSSIARAAVIDAWRADDLALTDGDTVGSWISTNGRAANAAVGLPIFKRSVTPAGGNAVRFNRNRMSIGNSPVSGRTAFSIALVFRADAAGASDAGANWYGKSGLVDAEQGGVVNDWGTVITETGNVGFGSGNPDISTYSVGATLVDSNYHVAVFTWGAGAQAVYLENRARVSQSGVGTAARNNSAFSFGGINTDENGATRRFVGDMVEIRFYDLALSGAEATNVMNELRDTHIFGTLPRIRSFTASTNQIYLGGLVTLAWDTTNAPGVAIDHGIGLVPAIGTRVVSPTVTTTYTLTATNTNGVRTAAVTIQVDPGIPLAHNLVTNTPQNTARSLTLRGTDPQGSNLTYAIVLSPAHGSLTGTPPNVTYLPAAGYFGDDAFTFKVNDGAFDSAPATVSIRVVPPPTAPSGIVLSTTSIPSSTQPGGSVATLRAIDVNIPDGDVHGFSLVPGFGDNSSFLVNGAVLAVGPNFSASPGATFTVRLRVTDSANLSFEGNFVLTVVNAPQGVVINEVHYNGVRNVIHDEFIELHNPTDAAVDLSEWRIRGGIDFQLAPGTVLPARGFLVIAGEPATIQSRYGVAALGPWDGALRSEGEELTLRDALNNVVDRVDFKSEFPWPIASNGGGASMQLVNPELDNDLGSSWRGGLPVTPGATNSVFATNAAPNIRQVNHEPNTPGSSNAVVVTAKVTDPEGVAAVALAYQVVKPGNYIPATLPLTFTQLNNLNTAPMTNAPNPAFEAATNWTVVSMHDDGLGGDAVAGDGVYSVTLPPQANRNLVRYRITVTDTLGASRRAPFEDDESLNFAYFVYDGLPAYLSYSSEVLKTLPIYSLITRDADINQCAAWFNVGDRLTTQNIGGQRNLGRFHFNWEGAMVYDGVVYDHVHYRLRGANGRYLDGKRSFRLRFNDGSYLDAKDQTGKRFPTKWRELTTGKGQANQGAETFALNEVVNMFLWNKLGVPAPLTFHFHFRVLRGASEAGADQYSGDFWGLNWAQEKYDVNFLEAHGLPKGNLYKLVDNLTLGVDERRYQGPYAVTNAADFFNIENNLTGLQSTDWLLAHANYTNWFRYFAMCEAIRHYDVWPDANKNGAWYFEPIYGASNSFFGRMMLLPYDSTDTWGPTWNTGYDILFNGIFNVFSPPVPAGAPINTTGGDAGENPALQLEYRNVVRELRALLFQPDQINAVIDAHAGPLSALAAADHARWSNAPAPASYRSILPGGPGVTIGLASYAQDMKNFMFSGGNFAWWRDRTAVASGGWITRLDAIAAASGDDTNVPVRPTLTYVGTNGYPVDGLVFQSAPFSDAQGPGTFAAMQWRIAEILTPGTIVSNLAQLRLEYDAAWTSDELRTFNEFITIPAQFVRPEAVYRVRVRHKDNTGRWSQWSLPSEFRAGPRDLFSVLRTNLVFNEIMYNPPGEGAIDGDEFEFVELKNIGGTTLNLSGLFFSQGIAFAFTNGTLLPAGATFLLARNPAVLASRYPGVVAQGDYADKLNNDGETLTISHVVAGPIISLEYGDRAPFPVTADGFGFSLVRAADGSYRASAAPLGTPGADGGASTLDGIVINEVLSSSTSPLQDTIELLNIGAATVDISGWYLSDDPTFPWKFRVPTRPALLPGEFAVFTEAGFNPTPGAGVSFSLSSLGDDVYLFSADGAGQLTGYSHGFSFAAAQDGVSFGRYVNSVGEEQFPLQAARTFNAPNAGPRVGPLVVSEIHYHPKGSASEFLELRNVSGSAVNLFDPSHATNTWRVGGIGFSFPTGVTLGANATLLLVEGDPAAFRARFGVPAAVAIYQYAGNLQDSGEKLELEAPDLPTTNGVPYYAVDTVHYNDRKPWPLAADGAGASLQRVNVSAYGDDPSNWLAAVPTPGAGVGNGAAPLLTSHPVSRTNSTTTSATLAVSATGTPPLFYQWRFNGSNLDGATNSTLLLASVRLENSGIYQAVVFNSAGSADSSNAILTVRAGPSIVTNPTNFSVRVPPDPQANPTNRVTFSTSAITYNPPLRYQWQFNGVDIPSATNSTLSFTNAQLSDEGLYNVLVSDIVGPAVSQAATLFALVTPQLTVLPIAQSIIPGELVSVSAAATGNPLPFEWEWRRVSTPLATNRVEERFNVFTFVNTNPVGSTVSYRVIVRTFNLQATATFNISTIADADSDGMADSWETNYFGSSAVSAEADADGDGVSNRSEYASGTNPTNALSFLRVGLDASSGLPVLSFGAEPGRTYAVEYRDELAGGGWQPLGQVVARTNSRVETIPDPAWSTNRFYRVTTPGGL